MAQIHKLAVETDLKYSAEKVYVMLKNNVNNFPKLLPEIYKGVQVLEGDGKSVGTVRLWNNVVGGNIVNLKEKLESVDDKNRSITFNVIEGDVMNLYKTFTYKLNVNPRKGDECSVKWTLEFEKANEDVPVPTMFIDLVAITTKEVARLLL